MKSLGMCLVALTMLAACGGGNDRVTRNYGGAALAFASGPISQACMQADRKAANRRLCGCVQSVANRSLGAGDQRMAATFFRDPHRSQEIRQSDNARHEVFWKRYKAFTASAERSCKGY